MPPSQVTPALAASAIQKWLTKIQQQLSTTRKLLQLGPLAQQAADQYGQFSAATSLQELEKFVMSELFLRCVGSIIATLPPFAGASSRQALLVLQRKIASAVLISRHPDEMLGEIDPLSEHGVKAARCQFAADLLARYLLKVFRSIASGRQAVVHRVVQPFLFCIGFYSRRFDDWKAADAERMIQSVEETFSQSYANLLSTRVSVARDGAPEDLLRSAEMQVKRISEVLLRMLGKSKCKARLEELCASIEASHSEYLSLHPPARNAPAAPAPIGSEMQRTLTPPPESKVPQSEDEERASRYLSLLSALAGQENERLAHEITLDKNFRLQPRQAGDFASGDMSRKNTSLAAMLRKRLLTVMGDRLVSSLRRSNVSDHSAVETGMVVIAIVETESTVKVLRTQGEGLGDHLEVELLAAEQSLVIPRAVVKLTNQPRSGAILLQFLDDLCHSIAQLTPNRFDSALAHLKGLYDAEMLLHMIDKDALHPQENLLPILTRLQREIIALQAVPRVEAAERWLRSFEDAFFWNRSSSGEALVREANNAVFQLQPPSSPLRPSCEEGSDQRSGDARTWEEVLPLLPLYFERSAGLVEEIQRDMANYYISLLVPILQQHGPRFLAQRFQQRLLHQQVRLDSTVAFLTTVVHPTEALQATIRELIEADVLPAESASSSNLAQLLQSLQASPGAAVGEAELRPLVAVALLRLLQAPVRLDSQQAYELDLVPATLKFDAHRLASVRDIVDRICLECSLVIASRQLLQRYKVLPREHEEVELQHRLDVLLSDQSAGESGGVNRATIAAELFKYIDFAIYRSQDRMSATTSMAVSSSSYPSQSAPHRTAGVPSAPLFGTMAANGYGGSDVEEHINQALGEVLAENNTVFQLFQKRVYKVLLRAVLSKPYTHKLPSYSLHSRAQDRNLTTAIGSLKLVFDLNTKVHAPLYASILQSLPQL